MSAGNVMVARHVSEAGEPWGIEKLGVNGVKSPHPNFEETGVIAAAACRHALLAHCLAEGKRGMKVLGLFEEAQTR